MIVQCYLNINTSFIPLRVEMTYSGAQVGCDGISKIVDMYISDGLTDLDIYIMLQI